MHVKIFSSWLFYDLIFDKKQTLSVCDFTSLKSNLKFHVNIADCSWLWDEL